MNIEETSISLKKKNQLSKSKMNKVNMLQDIDNLKLSLRKKKLFETNMKRRKTESLNSNSFNEIGNYSTNPQLKIKLSDIEQFVPYEILQLPFSYEAIGKMLIMTKEANIVKYAITKFQIHCAIEQCSIPKELMIALAQCMMNEYNPISQQFIIHYNIISILINTTARNEMDVSFLYDKAFILNLHSMMINNTIPLDIKYDIIWLLDNMIKSNDQFTDINAAIDLVTLLEQAYTNATNPNNSGQDNENYLIIVLHCIDNIIQLSERKFALFKDIINDSIGLFIFKWNQYLTNETSNNIINKSKSLITKVLKRQLILLSNACNKTKKYIHIINSNSNVQQFITSILDILSRYTIEDVNSHKQNQKDMSNGTIKVSESSINIVKAKGRTDEICFESKSKTLITILFIIGNMLYAETDETYSTFVKNNLINILQNLLDKLILYCSSKHFNKIDSVFYYLAWLSNNFACQSIEYAKMLFFNSSIVPSLLKLNQQIQLAPKSQKELIGLFYNCFIENNSDLNYFLLSKHNNNGSYTLIDLLIETLMQNSKDNSLISLVIDFFNLIIQYYQSTRNKKDKSAFIYLLEQENIPLVLSKLQLSGNDEVSELALTLMSEFTEDRIDDIINLDDDNDYNEEDFDY